MRIDQKYRWFFVLMLWLSIAIGGYTIKSHLDISRDMAHVFNGTNTFDGITASDFTEADLAQRIFKFTDQAMTATVFLAKQNNDHRMVLSILALFHFVVGIFGLWATASTTQYVEDQNKGLKRDGLEAGP